MVTVNISQRQRSSEDDQRPRNQLEYLGNDNYNTSPVSEESLGSHLRIPLGTCEWQSLVKDGAGLYPLLFSSSGGSALLETAVTDEVIHWEETAAADCVQSFSLPWFSGQPSLLAPSQPPRYRAQTRSPSLTAISMLHYKVLRSLSIVYVSNDSTSAKQIVRA